MANRDPDALVSLAARLGDRRLGWNEIDFVGWKEFRRMAPTVIGLEAARLERLIAESDIGSEFYNILVAIRFNLRRFTENIESFDSPADCAQTQVLEKALIGLSIALEMSDDGNSETLRYVFHRLTYVNDRMKLIY